MLGIKKILRTVRKEFHGNEIFATNDPEMAILKWNHHRPRVGICAKSAQGQQQINPIAKFITQRKHCADGIIQVVARRCAGLHQPGRVLSQDGYAQGMH